MSNTTHISANQHTHTATIRSEDGKFVAHVSPDEAIVEDGLRTHVIDGSRFREWYLVFEMGEALREQAGIQ